MNKLIKARSSFLLMIDIQEKLMPAVYNKDEIINNSVKLLNTANELSVPLMVTEQYPQGIGETLTELKKLIPESAPIIAKNEFSCCEAEKFGDEFLNLNFNSGTRDTAILFGVETHICVLSTAMDMISKFNLNVVIAADSCGSRSEKNHVLALDSARSMGCLAVPTETIIYQLLERAGTPQFKALLPMLK